MAMYPENAVSDNPKNVLPGRLFPPLRAFCGTSASQVVISALIMSTLPLQNDYLEAKSNIRNQGNSLEEAKEDFKPYVGEDITDLNLHTTAF